MKDDFFFLNTSVIISNKIPPSSILPWSRNLLQFFSNTVEKYLYFLEKSIMLDRGIINWESDGGKADRLVDLKTWMTWHANFPRWWQSVSLFCRVWRIDPLESRKKLWKCSRALIDTRRVVYSRELVDFIWNLYWYIFVGRNLSISSRWGREISPPP